MTNTDLQKDCDRLLAERDARLAELSARRALTSSDIADANYAYFAALCLTLGGAHVRQHGIIDEQAHAFRPITLSVLELYRQSAEIQRRLDVEPAKAEMPVEPTSKKVVVNRDDKGDISSLDVTTVAATRRIGFQR